MRCLSLALLGLVALAGCVANDHESGPWSPWDSLGRVLAIDFSPQAAKRRSDSVHRVLGMPLSEAGRARQILRHVQSAPAAVQKRVTNLPAKLDRGLHAELARSVAVVQPQTAWRRMLPTADGLAATFARDLEQIGFMLGLERRPLGEIDDREHRTDPNDDHPEASFWARLRRRIFP